MRFLIDADLPRSIALVLQTHGHVGVDVRDIGMRSSPDCEIARHAQQNQFCLLSADWGFSDIRQFPPADYHGIVVLGLPDDATSRQIFEVLQILLNEPGIVDQLRGRLAVVEKGRIRLRPPLG